MKIMVVDDDKGSRDSVKSFLLTLGHDVVDFPNGRDAFEALPSAKVSLILSDVKMPYMTGIDLVRAISSMPLKPHVALFTGYGTMETVMEALQAGAIDYLLKPVTAEDIVSVINRVVKTLDTPPVSIPSNQQIMLGTSVLGVFSPVMEKVVRDAYTYHTNRNIPVLVRGETGTGKELITRLIHLGDRYANRPFIDINCAALTPSLFESELFGYEPGTFTGGQAKGKKGKLDIAQGGTLFLDEVADIPLEVQGKLLRFIQEKTFYRVGGLKRIEADVRIICATNLNLEYAVSEGRFRSDLYYRLKVGQIFIPPLRERPEEILPLSQFFLEKFTAENSKMFRTIGKKAGEILLQYDWPGNVRELSNIIEVATTMFNGEELLPSHLNILTMKETRVHMAPPKLIDVSSVTTEKITNQLLTQAISANKGNKTAAAKALGISRRSLYRLLDKTGTQLHKDNTNLQIFLNNIQDRVILFKASRSHSGTIVDFICEFVNAVECLAYGKAKEELIGRPMQEIWPGATGRIFDKYCDVCETGKHFHYQDEVNPHLSGIYERHVFKLQDGVGVVARHITGKLES